VYLLISVVYVYGCLLQDLEQARMEAEDAKLLVEEQRILSARAKEEVNEAHSSIILLQQQAAEAEGAMAAATAAWNSEREALEAAAAAAAELASADEVESRVQAAVSGEVCMQYESLLLYVCLASELPN
jgi:septal ring factor EnvC (AmiA/AmiB activator)